MNTTFLTIVFPLLEMKVTPQYAGRCAFLNYLTFDRVMFFM